MSNFIICTFYTPSYSKYLAEWEKHVKATGYDYTARELPDRGKWSLNDCMKPMFIRDMLIEHPDKNIVWVDVDSSVVKKPVLFESLDCDIAGYLATPMPSERKFINKQYKHKELWGGKFVLGGILYFAQTYNSISILNLWVESCNNDPNRFVGDQDNLNEILNNYAERIGLRFTQLPIEYSFCVPHAGCPEYAGYNKMNDAVILHDFASRDARRRDRGQKDTWVTRLGIAPSA